MSYFDNNKAFGIVTVMDVKVYAFDKTLVDGNTSPAAFYQAITTTRAPIAEIDHLQVATLSTDGPSITINGGKYNNPLIKYGKTARCEMTDALGQADALVALGGAELDEAGNLSITDKFGAPVTMIGHTFVVDKDSGAHIPMEVVLYEFLPDSTPSFAFDSGNAATFDLNGDLLAVELGGEAEITEGEDCPMATGVFFSFIPTPACVLPETALFAALYGHPAQTKLSLSVVNNHAEGTIATVADGFSIDTVVDGGGVLTVQDDYQYNESTGQFTLSKPSYTDYLIITGHTGE